MRDGDLQTLTPILVSFYINIKMSDLNSGKSLHSP